VTGEGFLDEQSFNGKAVGGVVSLSQELGVPIFVVAGDGAGQQAVPYLSLVRQFGRERAFADTLGCIEEAVQERLRRV
jgi:glycerate kinase